MTICVYGAASSTIDNIYITQSELLGKELGKRGITMVFGGGGNGVMGASARGVYSENGKIIGVVPSFFNVDGVLFDHCTEIIYTETMRQRKQTMEDLSDAFIVAPGGIGTFDEFFEILTLQNLGRHTKPIVLYNVNGFYDGMIDVLKKYADMNFITRKAIDRIIISDSPTEILDTLCAK